MIKKFYTLILTLIKAKWTFNIPLKKQVVIYDHGEDHLDFLDKSSCFNLSVRGEEINIFILLKTILNHGFLNLKNKYRITLIKAINPKFIITFRCDSKNFYLLKKDLINVKTILIQWGKTIREYLVHNKEKNKNFHVDQMYLFGKETSKEFSKFIKGETFSIGSMPNNKLIFQESLKKNTLIFVSQFKPNRKLPKAEKIILSFLKEFCEKKNITLRVSTRVLEHNFEGKKVYEKILGKSGWDYCPRKSLNADGDYEAYKKVMLSEYVVFVDSTLGYEALSRKKKVAVFSLGCTSKEWSKENFLLNDTTKEFYQPSCFGFPVKMSENGEFWTSSPDQSKMTEILEFITRISDQDWLELLEKYKVENIISFDKNNQTLINNLKKIDFPLRSGL